MGEPIVCKHCGGVGDSESARLACGKCYDALRQELGGRCSEIADLMHDLSDVAEQRNAARESRKRLVNLVRGLRFFHAQEYEDGYVAGGNAVRREAEEKLRHLEAARQSRKRLVNLVRSQADAAVHHLEMHYTLERLLGNAELRAQGAKDALDMLMGEFHGLVCRNEKLRNLFYAANAAKRRYRWGVVVASVIKELWERDRAKLANLRRLFALANAAQREAKRSNANMADALQKLRWRDIHDESCAVNLDGPNERCDCGKDYTNALIDETLGVK